MCEGVLTFLTWAKVIFSLLLFKKTETRKGSVEMHGPWFYQDVILGVLLG